MIAAMCGRILERATPESGLPADHASPGRDDEPFVRCFGTFRLRIPFSRRSVEVHAWIGAVGVNVVAYDVIAHLG